ncbi:alpha/beta fold hydrolase [Dyella koreensis]|uniref:AB hydrolase-1 domain-containing protein n=1 Tax=Dyella koreensis TaxID=311235 RepID=A0ABW8K8W2_9GAMM
MGILRRVSAFFGGSRRQGAQRLAAVVLTSLALFLSACSGGETPPASGTAADRAATSGSTTPPKWVYQSTPHAQVAVVFVHGIFGDTLGTWTNDNGTTFFKLLKDMPGIGDRVDVYAFGFESYMFKGGSLDMLGAADKLDDYLKAAGVWDYPSVVFVAHSMGGLVVMRELVKHRERLDQVPLLVLYATPQEGASITSLAQHVVSNPAIAEMFQLDSNTYLQTLDSDWRSLDKEQRPTVVCARETKETHGVMIVPMSSSSRFCDDAPSAIGGADHLSIVKPQSADDHAVVVLFNALREVVFGTPEHPLLALPSFKEEDNHWTFDLHSPNGDNAAVLTNNGKHMLNYTTTADSDLQLWRPDQGGIPSGHSGVLLLAIRPSSIRAQYSFDIQVPVLGSRHVIVHVPDVSAVQGKQDELLSNMAAHMKEYLATVPPTLSTEERNAGLAAAAGDVLAKASPDLPPSARWVMTADALAFVGLNDVASHALNKAGQTSPDILRSPTAQLVAQSIATQSGKPQQITGDAVVPKLTTEVANAKFTANQDRLSHIIATDPQAWTDLSAKFQDIPVMQSEGLGLKGDVLKAQGKVEDAKKAYIDAGKAKSSPLIDRKIEAVNLQQAQQVHL